MSVQIATLEKDVDVYVSFGSQQHNNIAHRVIVESMLELELELEYPFFLKCAKILQTASIGTAKANPSAPLNFILLTPIISPSALTSGPPEFPYAQVVTGKTDKFKRLKIYSSYLTQANCPKSRRK